MKGTRQVTVPALDHAALWHAAEPILRASRYSRRSHGPIQPEEADWAMVTWLAARSTVWVFPGPDAAADRDQRLYGAIAAAYPDLAAECRRQRAGERERPFSEPYPAREEGWDGEEQARV
jgi:hypothetical protein